MKTKTKHALWLRVNHWLNVPLLALMIWSGLLIYWANDVYPFFFPEVIYAFFGLSQKLAQGLATHFTIGWIFTVNGLIYAGWLIGSGHWRELAPSLQTLRDALPTVLHDLGLRAEAPPHGTFNAMQKLTYCSVIAMAALEVASGFAIYKPVQLSWLAACFGGYQGARLVHFVIMVALSLFIVLHVMQVVRAGWENFRAMVGRTAVSFVVLGAGLLTFALVWYAVNQQEAVDGTPKPLRRVLEVNGKIWKRFSNMKRLSECRPPAKGTIPRVNGDIGLSGEAANWRLEVVAGDQLKPIFITLEDLKALPRTETSTEFRCIEGWSEDMAFAGVKFSDFMRAYNLSARTYVGMTSSDGEYYVSMDMESMLHQQTLLAYEMNGEPLRPENGAPLRLVIPVKYGIKNIKHIGRIFFSDVRPPDYWAEQGYDWYAGL